jgi:hypothetical protein
VRVMEARLEGAMETQGERAVQAARTHQHETALTAISVRDTDLLQSKCNQAEQRARLVRPLLEGERERSWWAHMGGGEVPSLRTANMRPADAIPVENQTVLWRDFRGVSVDSRGPAMRKSRKRIGLIVISGGRSPRGRFATPARSSLRDCSPYYTHAAKVWVLSLVEGARRPQ